MKKDNAVYVIVSLIISLAVFAAALIILKWAVLVSALLSLGCYAGLTFLFTPVLKLGGINIERMKNGEEIMALVDEGEKDLVSIKTIADRSKDPRIKMKAHGICREGGKIIEYIKKNPAKAVMARRFFNYYLNKAEEILKKFHGITSAEIETNRLSALTEKTLSALDSIYKGMGLQFSRLISSELIDIEAEIKLLESTLRMEDS